MISIGNDIVSLSSMDRQRTLDPRYYSKILSTGEVRLFSDHLAALEFEQYVWMAWSLKESAYKYLKRKIPVLEFSPTKFVVQTISEADVDFNSIIGGDWTFSDDDSLYSGKIKFDSNVLHFRAIKTPQWIASMVNLNDDFRNVSWAVQEIDGDNHELQSSGVRNFLLSELADIFTGDIVIRKDKVGYPVAFQNGEVLDFPISLSHHGRYVSYAFNLSMVGDLPMVGVVTETTGGTIRALVGDLPTVGVITEP
ncbi:hypothetical protein BH10BAC4_BH10BAC4_16620 [soil metagenome]